MPAPPLSWTFADMAVDEFLTRYKNAIPVFMRRRLLCIGCPFGHIHSVRDACTEHQIEPEPLLRELADLVTPHERPEHRTGPSAPRKEEP
ncbi:DUF1858 domain-containing protein [Afifella marina]|uniref:Hybrid cluster protein-associated redox disulfide domain-containing protein n=1 Tax=Afifella marina DSM 2698 TaxID=1120955 RepID=A0A1G5P4C8_AFIMA|nr:DUF1858 domain-containing protein [Afifella marina]MBK1625045.1 hypothetical protein [Afifella marina DSM 2698]MBK1628749.1 hypothetical protein [Afifella marina]MBK5918407.1 hypothetical protein [Afifella marina]RAI19533.1 hypothetical protein CH311_12020 [Afifella marina DSM 2698]SCZ44413.1 hybrid cluster protein-associated redox disulfide domain-containing protein [Afifella marina DSM 2698]